MRLKNLIGPRWSMTCTHELIVRWSFPNFPTKEKRLAARFAVSTLVERVSKVFWKVCERLALQTLFADSTLFSAFPSCSLNGVTRDAKSCNKAVAKSFPIFCTRIAIIHTGNKVLIADLG